MTSVGKLGWCQEKLLIVFGKESFLMATSKDVALVSCQWCSVCGPPTLS